MVGLIVNVVILTYSIVLLCLFFLLCVFFEEVCETLPFKTVGHLKKTNLNSLTCACPKLDGLPFLSSVPLQMVQSAFPFSLCALRAEDCQNTNTKDQMSDINLITQNVIAKYLVFFGRNQSFYFLPFA